jgi:hypothetical protein
LKHVGKAHATWLAQLVGLAIGSGLPCCLQWKRVNAWRRSRQMKMFIIQYIQYGLSKGEKTGQKVPKQIENCIIVTITVFGRNFF